MKRIGKNIRSRFFTPATRSPVLLRTSRFQFRCELSCLPPQSPLEYPDSRAFLLPRPGAAAKSSPSSCSISLSYTRSQSSSIHLLAATPSSSPVILFNLTSRGEDGNDYDEDDDKEDSRRSCRRGRASDHLTMSAVLTGFTQTTYREGEDRHKDHDKGNIHARDVNFPAQF